MDFVFQYLFSHKNPSFFQNNEKLELTDQLSHEKHINKELQDRLNKLNQDGDDHCHGHDHDHHHSLNDSHSVSKKCESHSDEGDDDLEPLVNDSHEVNELRNIIRQLQDDKIQLKERLNYVMTIKNESGEEVLEENPADIFESEFDDANENHEDTKLRLRQMEEKVRKTMNEIAVLDEEKEKLEHLVLQLQSETETIGKVIGYFFLF